MCLYASCSHIHQLFVTMRSTYECLPRKLGNTLKVLDHIQPGCNIHEIDILERYYHRHSFIILYTKYSTLCSESYQFDFFSRFLRHSGRPPRPEEDPHVMWE
jgi:hypothetical protein